MKQKYYIFTANKTIEFIGWFEQPPTIFNVKNENVLPPLMVLEDSDLYRFIEQSKAALNHN